jgi:hypothetical protein
MTVATSKTFWKRVKAIFASNEDSVMEFVLAANLWASIAIFITAVFRWGLPLPWAVALVPAAFVLLFVFLLYRPTVWLAALLGTPVIAVSTGLAGAALAMKIDEAYCWPAGVLAGVAGSALAIWVYLQAGKIARSL